MTNPTVPTTILNAATFTITGTAESNSLVKVYVDVNNNGAIDAGDTVVAQQQLAGGSTAFSISTPLTQEAANNFVVTATDAAVNPSAPADVPTITNAANPTVVHGSTPTTIDLNAAPTDGDASAFNVTLLDPLFAVKQQFGLGGAPELFNARGAGEYYLPATKAVNGYVVLLPNGEVHAHNATATGGDLLTTVPKEVYENPLILTASTGVRLVTVPNPLYDLKVKYGLNTPVAGFNDRGAQEKYFISSNKSSPVTGQYVIKPDNKLYMWDGSTAGGTFVLDLAPYGNIYLNPAALTSATLGIQDGISASTTATPDATPGGSVTLTPLPGFDRSVNVVVTAVNGSPATTRSFTYTVVDTPPAIGTQNGTHTQQLNIPLTPSDTDPDALTRTYSVEFSNPLYDIKTKYGLDTASLGTAPLSGTDKYFGSSNNSNPGAGRNQFVIKSDNKLYTWNGTYGGGTAGGTQVFDFNTLNLGNVFLNPNLLTAASLAPAPVTVNRGGPLYELKTKFGLDTPVAAVNVRNAQELYFIGAKGSNPGAGRDQFVLLPNGNFFAWDGATAGGTLIANIGTQAYLIPSLLYQAKASFVTDPLAEIKSRYGLSAASIGTAPASGTDKYFLSTNGSNPGAGGNQFVLKSNNRLYTWNGTYGGGTAGGTEVADFNTLGVGNIFNNPALLFNASGEVAPAVGSVAAGTLTLTPNIGFTGTLRVTLKPTDGALSGGTSFLWTVTNTTPTQTQIAPVSGTSASAGTSINLTAYTVDGDSLKYAAALSDPYVAIKTKYGLDTASIGTSSQSGTDKYFLSSNGSNPGAGRNQFVLKASTNQLFAWDGTYAGGTAGGSAVFDFNTIAPASVFANPDLLVKATPPANLATVTASISPAGVLTIAWPTTYSGKFNVEVATGDGAAVIRQSFMVTVS